MPNQTFYLYINSKNRLANEYTHNFNVYLKNQIIAGKNQGINISVQGFHMINSMYNINTKNNTFVLRENNLTNIFISDTTVTIPFGNYSALTFRDTLNNLLSNKINVVYNYPTNTFTFTNLTLTSRYYIIPNKASQFLGISVMTEILTAGTNGSYINMVNYSKIIIKCPTLQFDDMAQDNITTNNNILTISNILFLIDKQDKQPFEIISYKNADGGENYSYNIVNNNISYLNFLLFNENNEILSDANDYIIELKIRLFDKNEDLFKEIGIQSLSLLDDINFTLLNILFKSTKKNLIQE